MKRSDIVTEAMSAEENWREYLETNIPDNKYSDTELNDFYNVLGYDYAIKVGYTNDTTYRLVVSEILEGEALSAEYILLNDVMPINALYHYAIFLMERNPEKLIGISREALENAPVLRSFENDNKNINELWAKDPEFVERMILTRVITSYGNYCDMIDSAQESLKFIESDREYYRNMGLNPKDMEIDEAEINIKNNIERYELIVNLIEILFDSGAKVYSPSELSGFVNTYLSNLVKSDEERFNPFVKSEKKTEVLPGELRIQAFMEAKTGKDWVLPR